MPEPRTRHQGTRGVVGPPLALAPVPTDVTALPPRAIPNPLRMLGLARILAGTWFIATSVATVRHNGYLLPQAERLFGPDAGTTGAPLRSLLTLIIAADE